MVVQGRTFFAGKLWGLFSRNGAENDQKVRLQVDVEPQPLQPGTPRLFNSPQTLLANMTHTGYFHRIPVYFRLDLANFSIFKFKRTFVGHNLGFNIIFGLIFLIGFHIMLSGVYRKIPWLYVKLMNISQPISKSIVSFKTK